MERIFLCTTGDALGRALCSPSGNFEVETLLRGMEVSCLTVDPLNVERVYAGTQGLGVLRSDDRGQSWQSVGLAGHSIKAISASPLQQGVAYAGTKPARLYRSTDSGVTWEELSAFRRIPWRWFWFSPAEKPYTAYVQAIALSLSNPERIVVGIEAGATLVSNDGGHSWSGHRRGSLRDCHSLVFHARDGQWIYEAGGSGGGAAFSRDGGNSWIKAGQGLDRQYCWAVAADAIDPSCWYVSASPGPFKAHGRASAQAYIFRREANGWLRLGGGLPQPLAHMPYVLIAEPDVAGSLYAGLSNGNLWHSNDFGERWRQLPVQLPRIHRALVIL